MKIKKFTFNSFQENTYVISSKKKCIIIGLPQLFRKAQEPKKDDAIHLFMKEFESWE